MMSTRVRLMGIESLIKLEEIQNVNITKLTTSIYYNSQVVEMTAMMIVSTIFNDDSDGGQENDNLLYCSHLKWSLDHVSGFCIIGL